MSDDGQAVGVSKDNVQRIWSQLGTQPHRVDNFKVSNDPAFTEKVIDVVGSYLNPTEQAVVLCMDEKSQIQALRPFPRARSSTASLVMRPWPSSWWAETLTYPSILPSAFSATRTPATWVPVGRPKNGRMRSHRGDGEFSGDYDSSSMRARVRVVRQAGRSNEGSH